MGSIPGEVRVFHFSNQLGIDIDRNEMLVLVVVVASLPWEKVQL